MAEAVLNERMFARHLQRALHYLYDPSELQRSPLVRLFGVEHREDTATALRRILVESIETLRPDKEVPLQSNAWRYYHILFNRYVEQFLQSEVASDLGLSIRQLRRQEKAAIDLLARYLWSHYKLDQVADGLAVDTSSSEHSAEGMERSILSRQQELEWAQKSLPSTNTDIRQIVEAAVKVTAPLQQALQTRVWLDLSHHLPRISVQSTLVQQALLNLLTLSLRAAQGGNVHVWARAERDSVTVRIGPIAAGLIRESESVRMARELILATGGELQTVAADQADKDRLAFVQFALPVERQILVMAIDDNPDTLKLLQRYTAGTVYTLVGVQDPREAVERAVELRPQLVVLDVMLPEIDGWELLGRLRAHPALLGVPIIVATILPQEALALALGATAFLRKPLSRRTFLAALDRQIDLLQGQGVDERFNGPQ